MRKSIQVSSKTDLGKTLDKAKPGFVTKLQEHGYREAPVPREKAEYKAVQTIRCEHAIDGDALEERFLNSRDAFEAERIAATLVVLNSERAVSAFERTLESESEPLRKVAVKGLSKVIRTTEFEEDRECALDVMERAANRGVREAAQEIKENLLDCGFRPVDKMNLRDILRLAAALSILCLNSRLLPVGAVAGSAFSFMNGGMNAGIALGAVAVGTHLVQKYLFRSV